MKFLSTPPLPLPFWVVTAKPETEAKKRWWDPAPLLGVWRLPSLPYQSHITPEGLWNWKTSGKCGVSRGFLVSVPQTSHKGNFLDSRL